MTGLTSLLLWYLAITLAGWITFPLAYRLFKGLPDRGVSVSKILAWLLWGYLFWMFASVGIFRNEWFGILACLLILAGINLWLLREGGFHELIEWLKTNRRTIFVIEMLFMVSFIGWALVRATNPEALGTEKPMELAFINAILRSPTFPPHDPWLSGYSISYYHFGYVLVAMLSKLTGTSGGVAFNLGSALIFGLAAIGAFGLIFNILNTRSKPIEQGKALGVSLFGPLFLLAFSNFEGFLHSLHNRGLFWRMNEAGELTSSFGRWLDILDLNTPPAQPFTWIPDRFWWWWRASRVIQDYDMTFNPREIINEFPFFSFLLADLHPHVLAIPFALLCITLALHILLKKETASQIRIGPIHLCFTPSEMLLAAIITGAMGFLNTWDFPIYVGFITALVAFRQSAIVEESSLVKRLVLWGRDFIVHGLALGVTGILLYLPFYISFSSQAGGLILNFIYPTRGAHLWVMFGGLFVIMGI